MNGIIVIIIGIILIVYLNKKTTNNALCQIESSQPCKKKPVSTFGGVSAKGWLWIIAASIALTALNKCGAFDEEFQSNKVGIYREAEEAQWLYEHRNK